MRRTRALYLRCTFRLWLRHQPPPKQKRGGRLPRPTTTAQLAWAIRCWIRLGPSTALFTTTARNLWRRQ